MKPRSRAPATPRSARRLARGAWPPRPRGPLAAPLSPARPAASRCISLPLRRRTQTPRRWPAKACSSRSPCARTAARRHGPRPRWRVARIMECADVATHAVQGIAAQAGAAAGRRCVASDRGGHDAQSPDTAKLRCVSRGHAQAVRQTRRRDPQGVGADDLASFGEVGPDLGVRWRSCARLRWRSCETSEGPVHGINLMLSALGWIRTSDPLLRRQPLCPLSYEGVGL